MTTKEEILKLAEECDMATAPGGNGYWDNAAQIEAFYHAARKPLEEQYASMTKSFFDAQAQLREALAVESKWRVEATGLRQQLAEKDAQITLLKSHVANVKSNLLHQRRFGTDTFQCWVNAAARAEGDIEEALALPADTSALEVIVEKAGEVMRERSATVCDKRSTYYGRASAESQEAKDCAFNIRALPGVKLEDLK